MRTQRQTEKGGGAFTKVQSIVAASVEPVGFRTTTHVLSSACPAKTVHVAPTCCVHADLCELTVHVHAGFKALAQGQEKKLNPLSKSKASYCTDADFISTCAPWE